MFGSIKQFYNYKTEMSARSEGKKRTGIILFMFSELSADISSRKLIILQNWAIIAELNSAPPERYNHSWYQPYRRMSCKAKTVNCMREEIP